MGPLYHRANKRLSEFATILFLTALVNSVLCRGGQDSGLISVYYLLIDTSTSMNEVPKERGWTGSKIAEVKRQLEEFCVQLPTESRLRIYLFDEGAPRQGPQFDSVTTENRQHLRQFFRQLQATGAKTYAWRSLDFVLNKARIEKQQQPPSAEFRLLMFTDSQDNDPTRPSLSKILLRHQDILKGQLNPVRVSLVTLGFKLPGTLGDELQAGGVEVSRAIGPIILPLVPVFDWLPKKVVVDEPVQFFDKSGGLVARHEWQFGDGSTSAERAPKHTFRQTGSFTVRLTITNPEGRSESVSRVVVVDPRSAVEADFEQFPIEPAAGAPVLFRNKSRGSIRTVAWDFGDGSRSDEFEPQHVYAQPGSYAARLTVYGTGGEVQSKSRPIQVAGPKPPKADFVSPAVIYAEEPAMFFDRSAGLIEERTWNFGDGTPSVGEQDPSHVFAAAGDYQVTLSCRGPGGSAAKTLTVRVLPVPALRAAFDWAPKPVRVGQITWFIDQSEGAPTSYQWQLGPAGTSTERNPSATFSQPGLVEIRLTVERKGKIDTLTKTLEVLPNPLKARFSWVPRATTFHDNQVVTFIDESEGGPTSYLWKVGPFGTFTNRNPEVVLTVTGLVQVVLTVAREGTTDTASNSFVVVAAPPLQLDFDWYPKPVVVDEEVQLINRSESGLSRYVWNVAGVGIFTQREPHIRFPKAGEAEVRLTGYRDSRSNTVSKIIEVQPRVEKPDASFTPSPRVLRLGEILALEAKATNGGLRHDWVVARAVKLTGASVSWSADRTGRVEIVHQVVNQENQTNTHTDEVWVMPLEALIAKFNVSRTLGRAPLTVSFLDKTEGRVAAYEWDFGDGVNSTEKDPTHTYTNAGTFHPRLAVKNVRGERFTSHDRIAITVKRPLPPWLAPAVGGATMGLAALLTVLACRPRRLVGRVKWEFAGAEKVVTLTGRSFDLADLGIPSWKPRGRYRLVNAPLRGGLCLVQEGGERLKIHDRWQGTIDGARLTYYAS